MTETKLKLLIFLILPLLLPAFAITAPTQNQPKSISLTAFIGFHSGYEFGQLNPLPNTADVPEIGVSLEHKAVPFGISLGYLITNHFELQSTVIYSRAKIVNDVGIGVAGIPLGITEVSEAETFSYSGNVLYHVPFEKYSLYFTAGLGAVTIKTARFNTQTGLLLNVGIGIRAKFGSRIQPILEIRDYISFFDFAQDFDVAYPAMYSQDFRKSQHNYGIHIGLSYIF